MPDSENPSTPAISKRNPHLTDDYLAFLGEVKSRIAAARSCAARSVNHEMILLYWDIGRGIVEKQQALGWGESVVERLAADLREAFPGVRGYSARNLREMKRLYLSYSAPQFWQQAVAKLASDSNSEDSSIWQQAVAKLEEGQPSVEILRQTLGEVPWGQHLLIFNKTDDPGARLYYLRATARFGWSRSVLMNQIKGGAYQRAVQEKKTHNFDLALPEHMAEQADEMLKSRYNLEFLGIGQAMKERELEDRLIERLQQFILKTKTKTNPIGVAEYRLQSRLPAEFKGRLPSARQLADAVREALPDKE